VTDTNFVVKNGLVVNSSFAANSTQISLSTINATSNGVFANTTSITIGNASVNTIVTPSSVSIANSIIINSSAVFVGNATSNAYVTSNGLYVNGSAYVGTAGYYKGNNGAIGNTNNLNNIFRLNGNTISANITFLAGENASAVGPLVIGTGNTVVVSTGARVVII